MAPTRPFLPISSGDHPAHRIEAARCSVAGERRVPWRGQTTAPSPLPGSQGPSRACRAASDAYVNSHRTPKRNGSAVGGSPDWTRCQAMEAHRTRPMGRFSPLAFGRKADLSHVREESNPAVRYGDPLRPQWVDFHRWLPAGDRTLRMSAWKSNRLRPGRLLTAASFRFRPQRQAGRAAVADSPARPLVSGREVRRGVEPHASASGARSSDKPRHGLDPGGFVAEPSRLHPRNDRLQRQGPAVHTVQTGEANARAMLAIAGEWDAGIWGCLHGQMFARSAGESRAMPQAIRCPRGARGRAPHPSAD